MKDLFEIDTAHSTHCTLAFNFTFETENFIDGAVVNYSEIDSRTTIQTEFLTDSTTIKCNLIGYIVGGEEYFQLPLEFSVRIVVHEDAESAFEGVFLDEIEEQESLSQ